MKGQALASQAIRQVRGLVAAQLAGPQKDGFAGLGRGQGRNNLPCAIDHHMPLPGQVPRAGRRPLEGQLTHFLIRVMRTRGKLELRGTSCRTAYPPRGGFPYDHFVSARYDHRPFDPCSGVRSGGF